MIGYSFAVSCPLCGGECCPIASGEPIGGTSVGAVFACCVCDAHWHALVTVRRVVKPESQRRYRYRPLKHPAAI